MKHVLIYNFIVHKIFSVKIVEESAMNMIRVQNLCTMNYALFIIKSGFCIFCIRQQLDVRLFL